MRHRAEHEKEQQIQKRDEEQEHEPAGKAGVAQPAKGQCDTDPDERHSHRSERGVEGDVAAPQIAQRSAARDPVFDRIPVPCRTGRRSARSTLILTMARDRTDHGVLAARKCPAWHKELGDRDTFNQMIKSHFNQLVKSARANEH